MNKYRTTGNQSSVRRLLFYTLIHSAIFPVHNLMNPRFAAILDELKKLQHNTEAWQYRDRWPRTLTLEAKHSAVGPLVIYDDGKELTLAFGSKYHCHFDNSDSADVESGRVHPAALAVADCVDRILRERLGVAVHFLEETCVGASWINLSDAGLLAENLAESREGIYGGNIRTERYLWFGPVGNPLD